MIMMDRGMTASWELSAWCETPTCFFERPPGPTGIDSQQRFGRHRTGYGTLRRRVSGSFATKRTILPQRGFPYHGRGNVANSYRSTVKLPFPLTPQFKSMLQSGVGTRDLDVRWVSSLSWYFLTLFGLQPVYNFILGSNNGMFPAPSMRPSLF
jgi:hypothetical protein